MHRLIIHKLGPVDDCDITCTQFMTFTGFQASGKSTITKAIFYFRTMKDDIYEIAKEQALRKQSAQITSGTTNLKKMFLDKLREKFLRLFGSSWGMNNDMRLKYYFTEQCYVELSLHDQTAYPTPNYIWIDISPALEAFLKSHNHKLAANALGIPELQEERFKAEYSVVYIPAGRSMLTLLSQQLNYIYTTMEASQRRTLDYCTQDYIERILRIKAEFTDGLEGIFAYESTRNKIPKEIMHMALHLIDKVLRGRYKFNSGEERIELQNDRYVKINFASSGQQESVWILNLICYYLAKGSPVLFMIEEPESHLFPESQKYMTHSPYVLGTLNNLLYAAQTAAPQREKVAAVISPLLWLPPETFDAWFVQEAGVQNCMDREMNLIQNERIDEISQVINREFDALFALQIENTQDIKDEVNICR